MLKKFEIHTFQRAVSSFKKSTLARAHTSTQTVCADTQRSHLLAAGGAVRTRVGQQLLGSGTAVKCWRARTSRGFISGLGRGPCEQQLPEISGLLLGQRPHAALPSSSISNLNSDSEFKGDNNGIFFLFFFAKGTQLKPRKEESLSSLYLFSRTVETNCHKRGASQ